MLDQPDVQHPLILTVALTRAPLDLLALLPTVEELNKCTAYWQTWEDLVRRKAAGEAVSDGEIAASLEAAEAYDAGVQDKQETAYATYQADYQLVVAESLPAVSALLQAYFGDRVRWPEYAGQMVTALLSSSDLLVLQGMPGIQRVSYNLPFGPMLEWSRLDVRADLVHMGDQSGTPAYTGAGVRIAIVDGGIKPGNSRRPLPAYQADFTGGAGPPDDDCSDEHADFLAGVVACTYSPNDPPSEMRRGIAGEGPDWQGQMHAGATLINARVFRWPWPACGGPYVEHWGDNDMPAFQWSVQTPQSARIINFSRGKHLITAEHTTQAGDLTSKNVDWLVDTTGVCFVHACGNISSGAERLSPPSGAYNCFSVGNYNDNDSVTRDDNMVYYDTSPGPTADLYARRKPDLCAPGTSICTPSKFEGSWSWVTGTSYAAPHVGAVCAMLLEARPSLNPRQIHAILIGTTDYALLPDSGQRQTTWDDQGGWGMLDAYDAVSRRNNIVDDSLAIGQGKNYLPVQQPPAGQEIVFACAWQRHMRDQDTAVSGSPGKLALRLDHRVPGGQWQLGPVPIEDARNNVQRVRGVQVLTPPFLEYRVRVVRVDDYTQLPQQEFTLACTYAINYSPDP